jgi:hypothetical protein
MSLPGAPNDQQGSLAGFMSPRKRQLYLHLIGGLEHGFYFSHHIGNVIIPTDKLHHFSEGLKAPTR